MFPSPSGASIVGSVLRNVATSKTADIVLPARCLTNDWGEVCGRATEQLWVGPDRRLRALDRMLRGAADDLGRFCRQWSSGDRADAGSRCDSRAHAYATRVAGRIVTRRADRGRPFRVQCQLHRLPQPGSHEGRCSRSRGRRLLARAARCAGASIRISRRIRTQATDPGDDRTSASRAAIDRAGRVSGVARIASQLFRNAPTR
jgi:hypothetical protein